MIIKNTSHEIDQSNFESSKKMSFALTGTAFKTISDNIYSDKLSAVVREIACNSFDAMAANGKSDQPFAVKLPTLFSPTLEISDTGVGMSEETVFGLYSTVFASSKTNTNTQTGCFGIGKLAALCYSESFILESIYEKTKSTYIVGYDKDGIPTVNKVNSEQSFENNGVTVKVAIKNQDFEQLYQKARNVFRDFKVRPIISGKSLDIPNIYSDIAGNGWKVRINSDYTLSGCRAIQSNVGYPIKINDSSFTNKQKALLAAPIDIEFTNGELNIAPSRENLSFDARTIANLQKRLNEIADELAQKFKAEFDAAPNMWAARMVLWKIKKGDYSPLRSVIELLDHKYKGQSVTLESIKFSHLGLKGYQFASKYTNSGPIKRTSLPQEFPTVPNVEFIVNDLKSGAWIRCKSLAEQGKQAVYLLEPDNNTILNELIDALGMGGVNLKKASELPKVANRAHYNTTAQGKAKVLKLKDVLSYPKHRDDWEVSNVDLDNPAIYFLIDHYVPSAYMYDSMWIRDLSNLGFDLKTLTVYGVKNSMKEKIEKCAKWVTIKEFAAKKIGELLARSDYSKTLARINDYKKINVGERDFFFNYKDSFNDSLLEITNSLIEEREFAQKNKNVEDYPNIAVRYGIPVLPEAPSSFTLQLAMKRAFHDYPMLKLLISTYLSAQDKSIVQSYLADRDEKLQKNVK